MDLGREYPAIRDEAVAYFEWLEQPIGAECRDWLRDMRVVHTRYASTWCSGVSDCGCATWTDAGPDSAFTDAPLVVVGAVRDPRAVMVHEIVHHLYECSGVHAGGGYEYDPEQRRMRHVGRVWRWLPPFRC